MLDIRLIPDGDTATEILPDISCPRCRKARFESLVQVRMRLDNPRRPLVRCLACGYEWRTIHRDARNLPIVNE